MKPTRGLYVVDCKASWEVLRYCEEELSGTRNLEEVITITGSPHLAQATSAVDYVDTIWGDEGLHLLRLFTRSLGRDTCGKLSCTISPCADSRLTNVNRYHPSNKPQSGNQISA
jgi:hypothetical protein